MILVHGGGLRGGYPQQVAWQAAELARRGYVAASVDYRVYPEAHWPGALEDVKCAIRWLRANAGELHVDPDRIGFVGGSAGGFLGALASVTPGQFEGEGGHHDYSSELTATVLFYPLTDTAWPQLTEEIRGFVDDFLGDLSEQTHREASAVTYVDGAMPPLLILTGDRDQEVPVDMVCDFVRRARAGGADVDLHVFPGRAHAFDFALKEWHVTFEILEAFLHEHLKR